VDGDTQSPGLLGNETSDDEWNDEDDEEEETTDHFIEGVNDNEVSLDQISETVNDLIEKIREIVTMIKSSSVFTSFMERIRLTFNARAKKHEKINRRLIVDVKSRWNSTYKMIYTFNMYRDFINDLFKSKGSLGLNRKQKCRFTRLELSVDQWDILQSIIELLHPFYSATKVLSDTKYPTVGSALYLLKDLEEYLSKADNNQTMSALKQLVLKKLQYYITDDVEQFRVLKVSHRMLECMNQSSRLLL
jgi:hypothetical protein